MFIRNGEVLGSVLHSAAPGADPTSEPVPDVPAVEPGVVESGEFEPPKHADSKADWVAFVVAKTADGEGPVSEEDAEAMTKADLIELYGG